jgi:hypothetical protein
VGRLKAGYVSTMRALRGAADSAGALKWLEAHRDTRGLLYLRSLFSIHDAEDMMRLDVPWWTFAATDWVDAFLRSRPAASTFEYGAGASTVWLARRCARVYSVEHDQRWAETVSRLVSPYANVTLAVVPPEPGPAAGSQYRSQKEGWRDVSFERYVRSIDVVPGQFDLIVVDGRCRASCLEAAVPRLAPGGIVVFDNTLRRRYRSAIAASGLRARAFTGLVPGLPYPDQTTVLGGGD